MKKKCLFQLLPLALPSVLFAQEKPNFLVVVCEDISPYLGVYGDSVAVTPNLDQFAQNATKHTSMFTTVGVSAPSRYSLITGRYSSNDGANYMRSNYFDADFEVVPEDGVKCFTEYLREDGYYCVNNDKTDCQFNVPASAWNESSNKAHWQNAPEGQPFYAQFNIFITHECNIWKQTNEPLAVDPKDINVPPYYPDNDIVRHDMAVMYSNVARMDKIFGQFLAELEASDKADNTIVIFFSDNGGPLPRGKRELLNSGSNVPFMIRFPEKMRSSECAQGVDERFAMFVDIPATILSLAGVEIPDNMQGEALYGEQKGEERNFVFGATDRFDEQFEKRGSIRDRKWLYVKNYYPSQSTYRPVEYRLGMPMMRNMYELYQKGELNDIQRIWFEPPYEEEQLYDCVADPHNVNNLAQNPKYRKVLRKMRKMYEKEWIEEYNKEWVSYKEEDFIKVMHPTGVKPQCPTPEITMQDGAYQIANLQNAYSVVYKEKGSKMWNFYTDKVTLEAGMEVKFCRIGYVDSDSVIIGNKTV